eukprot:scaffold85710_cov33-Phaeocystis_antarctica.AAC.1
MYRLCKACESTPEPLRPQTLRGCAVVELEYALRRGVFSEHTFFLRTCQARPIRAHTAHLLASTLPAVARATAACFVRCEWMVGRGLGLLRGSSSGWCVRCSPGRESLENGGPADKDRP